MDLGISVILLWLAVAGNTLSILFHRKKISNEKHSYGILWAHVAIITIMWTAFIVSLFFLADSSWKIEKIPVLAGACFLLSQILFACSLKEIGLPSMINANILRNKKPEFVKLGGVYKVFNNPMYMAFSLSLISLTLFSGVVDYMFLGLLMYVLLTQILVPVENSRK